MSKLESTDEASGPERRAFAALVACLLAPVLAQGLFRPLGHLLGPRGGAGSVTLGALALGLALSAARAHPLGRRRGALLLLGALLAVPLVLARSLGAPGFLALLAVAALTEVLLRYLAARLPAALDGLAVRHKVLAGLYLLFALAGVVGTARLSTYVGDPSRVDLQALPGDHFVERHSCLTAYVRASSLARRGAANLYDDRWWYGSNGLPPLPPGEATPYEPFSLDNFSYPPPFLLLASPLAPLEGDFFAQRALWFGLSGLLVAWGLWALARFVQGPGAHRVLLLAPLLLGSMPILVTLQIGNFQLVVLVLSVLAMVTLARGREAAGGALLALGIFSKISPGLLGILLLQQRRARAVLAVLATGTLLLALTALVFGLDPLESFARYALPRLSSGAAFPFMDTESGLATNMAPFGIPFKLRRLGFHVGDPWHLAPWVSRGYTVALVTVAALGARRGGDGREQAVRWLALLVLAALQSPFAPAYVSLGLLWATTLLAVEVRSVLGGLRLAALWLLLLVVPPGLSTEVRVVQSMAQTALLVAVCVALALRAPRSLSPAPEAELDGRKA